MLGRVGWSRIAIMVVLGSFMPTAPAAPQRIPKPKPRLEPIAETRLLMEGMIQPNFRGLEKSLAQDAIEPDTWTFVRGQALLVAEAGNLLLLRPPRNSGETAWQERSEDLRAVATRLAQFAAKRDTANSRAALVEVADVCNRCHRTFQVAARITPFADPETPKTPKP